LGEEPNPVLGITLLYARALSSLLRLLFALSGSSDPRLLMQLRVHKKITSRIAQDGAAAEAERG
jgi:hypothetical protein